jgi:hypothetical protein
MSAEQIPCQLTASRLMCGTMQLTCRPDFEAILAALEQAHPGTHVGVFYCGGCLP